MQFYTALEWKKAKQETLVCILPGVCFSVRMALAWNAHGYNFLCSWCRDVGITIRFKE